MINTTTIIMEIRVIRIFLSLMASVTGNKKDWEHIRLPGPGTYNLGPGSWDLGPGSWFPGPIKQGT